MMMLCLYVVVGVVGVVDVVDYLLRARGCVLSTRGEKDRRGERRIEDDDGQARGDPCYYEVDP